jgi:hypothetical protein
MCHCCTGPIVGSQPEFVESPFGRLRTRRPIR